MLPELSIPLPDRRGPAALDDPFYYLHNFRWVLSWVTSRYDELLSPAERQFAQDFGMLPRASQGFLVRMVMRKGEHFRAAKLSYAELGDLEVASEPLIELGWIDASPQLSVEILFSVFTWPELRKLLARELRAAGCDRGSKSQALAVLAEQGLVCWNKLPDLVYHLQVMPICDRFRLMFFGNLHQDWSEFVLTELGTYQYETVAFTEAERPFHSRAEIDTYLQLHACRERFYLEEPPEAICADLPEVVESSPWLVAKRDKLLFKMARQLEREGKLDLAHALYADCTYRGARSRLLRVMELMGGYEEALMLAEKAQANPESEEEHQHLQRLVPRLRRKLNIPHPKAPALGADAETFWLTLPQAPSVELAVAEHLQTVAAPVYYVENALLTGLFGLLCWDALFAPVSGAFFHPFQRGPADLYHPDFFKRRADKFSQCLQHLDAGTYRQRILETASAKFGLQSDFVYWNALPAELIEQALRCIPAAHLKLFFQRMLADLKTNSAGLPDLIQFWPDEQRYQLIEVKAPGDRLQDNQRRWLEYFSQHQIPVRVCYVRWAQEQAGAA